MRKRILILIGVNLAILLLAFAIAEAGRAYDVANELYPETYQFSYDAGVTVHGNRWKRIAMILVSLSFLGNALISFIWYRKYRTNRNKFPKFMKRFICGASIAVFMFAVGLAFSWLFPIFTYTGGISCANFYCLYHFRSTLSFDYE